MQTEKATKSSLEFKEVDYDTGFKDSQRLREMCHNLRVAQTILDSVLDIACAMTKLCYESISLTANKPEHTKDLLANVDIEIQRIRGFKRTAHALREQAEGTSQLVSSIDYAKYVLTNYHSCSNFSSTARQTCRMPTLQPCEAWPRQRMLRATVCAN
jgi:hypothetical protein